MCYFDKAYQFIHKIAKPKNKDHQQHIRKLTI